MSKLVIPPSAMNKIHEVAADLKKIEQTPISEQAAQDAAEKLRKQSGTGATDDMVAQVNKLILEKLQHGVSASPTPTDNAVARANEALLDSLKHIK